MVFDVTAQKITPKGQCIAYLSPESGRGGKATFIPGAIPGERLKVCITGEKRDWCSSRIVEVVASSPYRVPPACKWQPICGGCDFMHIEGGHQVALKKQILTSCLAHQGVAYPPLELVSGEQTHYRCRIRLHEGGFVKRASHEMAAVSSCLVATQEVNEYLAATPPQKRPKGSCAVFASRLLEVPPLSPSGKLPPQVVVQSEREEDNRAAVRLLGKRIAFDVRGFFQSNMELLEQTVPLVTAGLEGRRAVDLCSGVGVFALFLADSFDEVVAVERDTRAAELAKENLAGKRAKVYGESTALWCSRHTTAGGKAERFDAAVVDPPRGGMDKATVRWLCSSGIGQIRSLSCDSATHARDLRILCDAGYKVTRMVLLDFMPQTSHVESLAYLKR